MTDWAVPQREGELVRSAADELPALALVDDVSRLLGEVVSSVSVDPTSGEPPVQQVRAHALWFMGIIAFRAMRAARLAISGGYEDQAIGYQRLIDELHNRSQAVRADHSGEYARQWLAGRPIGKGAKLAGQDFWEMLSGPVHANVRAVLGWLAVSNPDGSTRVVVGPERRPEVANAALTYMASECRDIASLLAAEADAYLDLTEIDSQIHAAMEKYVPARSEQ